MSDELAKLGPYDILEVLQRGPRATLYIASRPDLEGELVVKVPSDRTSTPDWPTREIVAATQLLHRHIARLLDVGCDGDVAYLAMERLRGSTLQQLIDSGAFAADLPARTDLIAQLCIGLHYAHEQQVVHGSVRPDNVFVCEDGAVKILNFGATPSADRTMTSDHSLSGGFEYMSPEQIIGRDSIDGRSDVFSAGVLLYELVSGQRPFQGASTPATLARILRDEPAPLEGQDRLNAVLKRALEKDSARRFASAQELAYALWMLDMPEVTAEDESQAVPIVGRARTSSADTETAEQPAIPMPAVDAESRGSKLSAIVRKFWSR